jgi:cystathionine beta-lyase
MAHLSGCPADVLPLFVAEMDYPLAPPIKEALSRAIDDGDSGYVDLQEMPALRALADLARTTRGGCRRRTAWCPSTSTSTS